MSEIQGVILPALNDQGQTIVEVKEEENATGGHYQARTIDLNLPASTGWVSESFSFPFPISLFSAGARVPTVSDGDEVRFEIGPDVVVGAITADAAINDTEITVNATALANCFIGSYIKLDDGTNTNDGNRIINIDNVNSKLTFETALTNNFLAATPTAIKRTVLMIPHLRLTGGQRLVMGESKIGGSYIPANTELKISYNNVSGTSKVFSVVIEYMY
jgi:hypothetical protein